MNSLLPDRRALLGRCWLFGALLGFGLLGLALFPSPSASAAPKGFQLTNPRVSPGKVFFDGDRAAKLKYSFRAGGRRDVWVQVVRVGDGKVVYSWIGRDRVPGHRYKLRWRGLRRNGNAADDGTYVFRVGTPDGVKHGVGRFELHGYEFPVDGSHGTRGPIGAFHAPRSGGRIHEGFDITADCGTPIRAARGGRVQRAGYDPSLYGNFVLIDGRKSKRDTFYAHMRRPSRYRTGERVRTGARLGEIGQTGNAAGTPCHLHFELHERGRPIDPEPRLRRWDSWS